MSSRRGQIKWQLLWAMLMNSRKTVNHGWCISEHFEQFVACNSIPGGQVSTLLTVIGLKKYGLMHDLLSPTMPGNVIYATITTAMKEHVSPTPSMIAE